MRLFLQTWFNENSCMQIFLSGHQQLSSQDVDYMEEHFSLFVNSMRRRALEREEAQKKNNEIDERVAAGEKEEHIED